jgi:hypothetical protein
MSWASHWQNVNKVIVGGEHRQHGLKEHRKHDVMKAGSGPQATSNACLETSCEDSLST